MALEHMSQTAKVVGDTISIAAVIGTLASVLPAIAALVTIIWTGIRIFETHTVRKILGKEPIDEKGQG